jgi:predicted nucleotidyltransferase
MIQAKEILRLAEALPQFTDRFGVLFNQSEQVVIFGSYAAGIQNPESDIDILFVTTEKRLKTKYLDFVCLQPERVNLKTWLGSELANHIAAYGIWIKGNDDWKSRVFLSKSALERKKIIILNRLTHLWIKNATISKDLMLKLFNDVVLDSYRLVQMSEGFPVPPNKILVDRFLRDSRNILNEIIKTEYLGKVGDVFFDELFNNHNRELLHNHIRTNFLSSMDDIP